MAYLIPNRASPPTTDNNYVKGRIFFFDNHGSTNGYLINSTTGNSTSSSIPTKDYRVLDFNILFNATAGTAYIQCSDGTNWINTYISQFSSANITSHCQFGFNPPNSHRYIRVVTEGISGGQVLITCSGQSLHLVEA